VTPARIITRASFLYVLEGSMTEKITSRENAKIKYACRLAQSAAFRRGEGRFLAEGRKLCPELARGAELETLFYTETAAEKCPELETLPGEHYLVEDHVADKLADVGTHQGVFGVFRTPEHTLEEARTGGRYLALERVQDPGNVGTLLRSAAAFGFDGVLLSDGCASVWAPKTLRASMGAAVRIPVIEAGKMPEAIAALRAKGITCLAAALYKSQPLSAAEPRYPGGVCVVIGSEGQGLTEETIRACNGTVRIPMTDRVESLNAGIAGSILLWHFREESL
jgi:TrmH family RNA methyltransferase